MYGQGNYAPQFRNGHPIPPPPFHQGPPAPPPPLIQQGSLAAPNHAIQAGPSPQVYHHGPAPPPPPAIQQGQPIQVLNSGGVNAGQSFVHPPTSVHGNSQVIPPYSSVQHASHYPAVTTQSMHHMSPALHHPAPPLSGTNHMEIMRAPLPPRILPPLPSQGQTLYRTPLHPSLAGGLQGHQHVGPPPPPPPSCFVPVTPAPFSSFVHASVEDAYPPPMPPPPPRSPPSPPPIPSSPPPSPPKPPELLSDLAVDAVPGVSHHSESRIVCAEPTASAEKFIDDVNRPQFAARSRDDAPLHADFQNIEGKRPEMESLGNHGFSSQGEATMDLPPSPPNLPPEDVVQKIRVLCQFIAKNGPEFEDVACKKESGNPEFAFLFGGEPGSEAALAYDYFQWTKRKYHLASEPCKVPGKSYSSPETREDISSPKPFNLADEGASSPTNSDMEMEDDANQSSDDQEVGCSVKDTSGEAVSSPNAVKEKLHVQQSLTGCQIDTLPCTTPCLSAAVAKLEEEHDNSTSGMLSNQDHSAGVHFDGAVECTVGLSIKMTSSSPLKASSDAGLISHKEVSSPFIQGGSPFRLIQDYASDDSVEDDGISLENVSPVKVTSCTADGATLENVSPVNGLSCTADGATSFRKDIETDLDVNADSRMTGKEVTLVNESIEIDPINMHDISLESHEVEKVAAITSDVLDLQTKADDVEANNGGIQTSNDPSASLEVSEQKGSLHSESVSIDHQNKLQKEDAKMDHTPLEVDEFGRMVREGGSDSDSDGLRYSMRRGKRGRSRSRSPRDRRRKRSRSPRWRKERRSRSRSWSPKKRRSRSRSPSSFRRKGEFSIDKTKRERGRMPDCVNFLRGRCTRGASCWFLHDDSSLHDRSRHYKTKQLQHLEVSSDSRKPVGSEEFKKVTTEVYDFEEAKNQDVPVNITEAPKEEALDGMMDPFGPRGGMQLLNSHELSQSIVSYPIEVSQIKSSQEAIIQLPEKVKGEPVIQPEDFENLREPDEKISSLPPARSPKQSPEDTEQQNLPSEASVDQPLSDEYSVPQLPKSNASAALSLPMLENVGQHSQQMDSASMSGPLPLKTSTSEPGPVPLHDPYTTIPSASQPSSQSLAPPSLASEEVHASSYPSVDYRIQPSYLPPPPPLPSVMNASHVSQPPKDYNFPVAGTDFSSQSTPLEKFTPSSVLLQSHQSLSLGPQNPSWTSFQTPSYGLRPAQYPQNNMHSRNEFPQATTRPYQPEEHAHSEVGFHPRSFHPMEQPHRPMQLDGFRSEPLPASKIQEQHFGGPNFVREEHVRHSVLPGRSLFLPSTQQDYYLHPQSHVRNEQRFPLPVQDDVQNFEAHPNQRFTSQFQHQGFASSSQVLPFSRDSPAKQVQSFSKENFGAISSRQPPYGLQHSGTDVFSSHFGTSLKVDSSRYTSTLLESNKLALLSDIGGSKISNTTHYNPYASTFDQPPGSSKFNSSFFRRELDTNYSSNYETSLGPSHVRVDGQGGVGLGSRQTASPLDSGRPKGPILPNSSDSLLAADHAHPRDATVGNFPGTVSQLVRESMAVDQYDPLFDSIEPSSNASRKFDRVQERDLNSDVNRPGGALATGGSDVVSRFTGSHRPLDIAENTKQKEAADAAVTKSVENDEFGETAEVDAVESASPQSGDGKNWSPGSQDVVTGDVEIDQVKSPGKKKKSKDSRSMRLFKSAIADFVKEVLKPSWRQGNMSKEAFKTIVKKTVDKVSGAIKSHQIPKSQAKINQYIQSNERKLTKLVMGYVDKYVKL